MRRLLRFPLALPAALILLLAGGFAADGASGFASALSALNAIYNQLAAGISVVLAPNNGAPYSDPSQAVGTSAATLSFAHSPSVYLTFCDESSTADIAVNPTGTAALNSAGSHTLLPGGCFTFEADHVPNATWSAIAGAAATPLTVWYR